VKANQQLRAGILSMLTESRGGLTTTDLCVLLDQAKPLQEKQSEMNRLLRSLERKGYVARSRRRPDDAQPGRPNPWGSLSTPRQYLWRVTRVGVEQDGAGRDASRRESCQENLQPIDRL
jgi:hypothetical protein